MPISFPARTKQLSGSEVRPKLGISDLQLLPTKPAPGATLGTNPRLGSSAALGNEVWERNHRHPSGLATVSDRSWAKSSVYTGDYPGGLCGAPGAGAGQGTLLPVRPWGRAQSPGLVGSDPEGDGEQGFTQSQSASEKLHMTINWPAGPARRPNYSPTEPANKSWRALAQGWSALYWLERVHIERGKERGLAWKFSQETKHCGSVWKAHMEHTSDGLKHPTLSKLTFNYCLLNICSGTATWGRLSQEPQKAPWHLNFKKSNSVNRGNMNL